MVSTLDSESSDPSSNLGGTYTTIFRILLKPLFFMLFCKPQVLPKLTEKLTSEWKGKS